MLSANRYRLSRTGVLRLLEKLKADSAETASFCVTPGSPKTVVEGILETILDINTLPEGLSDSISKSPTGAILFWGAHHRYLVMPPFPVTGERASVTCEIEPLYTILHKDYILGLVMVRLGAYGIGVYRGEALLSSKVGTGLVHSRHRQGGSSAHRFERHREKQMETFFTRVCAHAREQLEPYARDLDFILYGGTRETLLDFRKQCHFMQQFDPKTLDLLLNIREPKKAGLEEGIREAWSSRVIEWADRQPS